MSVIKFIRDIARYFKYPSDDNPTTQQDYQNAVKNWVATETSLVDTILWQPETSYAVGAVVKTPSIASQNVLYCATAGVSGTAEPSYGGKAIGDSVNDGTVVWEICRVMPFIASKSVGGTIPIRLQVTGNSYKDIEVSHTDGNRVGAVRFSRTSTTNEVTLGASDGSNDPPAGLTVSREINNDFIYLKSSAQGLSTSRTFFDVYLNTNNPSSAIPSMQLNASTLNLYGRNIYDAKNLYFDGTGYIYGGRSDNGFMILAENDVNGPSLTLWGRYSASSAGAFRLRATLNDNNSDLAGIPGGNLTWRGAVVATSSNITNFLTTGYVNSSAATINSGNGNIFTIDISKSGYTPLGIVGYYVDGTGRSAASVYELRLNGTNAVIGVRNNGNSSQSWTARVYVLYRKNSL